MSWHRDDDPTGSTVAARQMGDELDRRLQQKLTPLQLTVLFEHSSGSSVAEIARKHRVPRDVVIHALTGAQRAWGDADLDTAQARSRLLYRLELVAARRCQYSPCGNILRGALEPRRGRPAMFCSPACGKRARRQAGEPYWQVGYLGMCPAFQYPCDCYGYTVRHGYEHVLVGPGPAIQRFGWRSVSVIIGGLDQGQIRYQLSNTDEPRLVAEPRIREYTIKKMSAGTGIEDIPHAEDAGLIAVEILALWLGLDPSTPRFELIELIVPAHHQSDAEHHGYRLPSPGFETTYQARARRKLTVVRQRTPKITPIMQRLAKDPAFSARNRRSNPWVHVVA